MEAGRVVGVAFVAASLLTLVPGAEPAAAPALPDGCRPDGRLNFTCEWEIVVDPLRGTHRRDATVLGSFSGRIAVDTDSPDAYGVGFTDADRRSYSVSSAAAGGDMDAIISVDPAPGTEYEFWISTGSLAGPTPGFEHPSTSPGTFRVRLDGQPMGGAMVVTEHAGTPLDPQIVDAEGDTEDAGLDVAGVWFDDPVLDDGVFEIGFRVPRLDELTVDASEVAAFTLRFTVLGDPYGVVFNFYPDDSTWESVYQNARGWSVLVVKREIAVLFSTPHVDLANGTLTARLPVTAFGNPPAGVLFENMTSNAARAQPGAASSGLPVAGQAPVFADEAEETVRPFALGGPEVWRRLRGLDDAPPLGTQAEDLRPLLYGVGGLAAFAALLALGAMLRRRRPAPVPASPPAPGEVFLGKWHVERELGRGTFAAAWLATDLTLKRPAVIKQLHPDVAASADARDRFRREAQILAAMRHPNVVQIYGVERVADAWYLVMEFADGGSLADRIAKGALPVPEATRLAAAALAGLAYIHGKGVLHRDLKPDNILLTADGDVKIADFGVAHSEDAHSPFVSRIDASTQGTPYYMAPEQVRGVRSDHRADLYAAAVTFHRMVSGGRYLECDMDDLFELRRAIVEKPPLPVPGLPAALAAWLARALAKEPAARFASAEEMRRALLDATA